VVEYLLASSLVVGYLPLRNDKLFFVVFASSVDGVLVVCERGED
jgi:hypothetical protein